MTWYGRNNYNRIIENKLFHYYMLVSLTRKTYKHGKIIIRV